MNTVSTWFLIGALLSMWTYPAGADELVSFATGGYASGLRTTAMMHKIDTNNDNMISRQEWIAFQNKVFTMLDRNNDGKVDENEYLSANPELVSFATGGYAGGLLTKEMFDKIDTDKDGTISRSEFLEYHMKIFDRMDTSPVHRGMLGAGEFFATGGTPAS